MSVASFNSLTVRYGNFVALNQFSCQIPEGCVGLLGPNGAGKTTLIKTILGFIAPTQGRGSVLGSDIATEGDALRQKVGLMPEQDCHIPGMNAVEFVAYAGRLAGMPQAHAIRRAHEVLEYCGLGEARYRNVETYSTGMKQRIKLAQALVHGPKLLLLDEPTNGLDPRGREEMLELVRSVSHGKGVNVLVSSHLLPDIERVCDEVIVVFRGELRAQGKIQDLKRVAGQPVDVELREPSPEFAAALGSRNMSWEPRGLSEFRVMGLNTPEETVHAVYACAAQAGAQVRSLAPAERSLEEAFMEAIHV